ncbi:MAG: hypothetical protein P1U36_04210 [Legionellaceae bacterium]|nr:hypothetical protein [Legionellaceae bacterium]
MIKVSDIFIFLAITVAFTVSAYLWFSGHVQEGIFTAIWVPSILGFAIYFKLLSFIALYKKRKDA